MKVAFVALLLVAGTFARSAVKEHHIQEEGPACPIDDPLISIAGILNITLEPILVINQGGMRGELVVTGLTTLTYTYDIQELALTAEFDIKLGTIKADTTFSSISGWLDATPFRQETIPSGDFEGQGAFALTGSNSNAKAKLTLLINLIGNKVTVRTLDIENLSFDTLTLDMGQEFLLNGKPVDWAAWNLTFKANFDADLAANKVAITEKIRTAANVIIGEYTLAELLELIGDIGGGVGEGCPTGAPIKIAF